MLKNNNSSLPHFKNLIVENNLDAIIITSNSNKLTTFNHIDCIVITKYHVALFAKWTYYPNVNSNATTKSEMIIYEFDDNYQQPLIDFLQNKNLFNIGCFSQDIKCDLYFKLSNQNNIKLTVFEESVL